MVPTWVRRIAVALLAICALVGCGGKTPGLQLQTGLPVELETVPFYPQGKNRCGSAALAMALGSAGVTVDPGALDPLVFLPGRKGSLQVELKAAARRHGRLPYRIDSDFFAIHEELSAGRPVLVLQNFGLKMMPSYHYAVVIGLLGDHRVVLRSGKNRRLEMSAGRFLLSWRRADAWAMVLLKPGELPARPDPGRFVTALSAFEESGHVEQAEAGYRAALSKWPDHPLFMFALGNNLLSQRKAEEAEALYRKIHRLYPDHIAAANNLADLLANKSCFSEAMAIIENAALAAERLDSPLRDIVRQTRTHIIAAWQKEGLPGHCAPTHPPDHPGSEFDGSAQ